MRNFLEACGLSTPLTIECDDPGLPAAISIRHEHTLPFVIVGRDPSSDFHLNDLLISRRHAYLQVIAGGLFCVDLGSRSRIQWDGAQGPATKGWLEPEQFLWLGGYRLRWRGGTASAAQHALRLDPLTPPPIDRADQEPLPEAALELPIRIGASQSNWPIGARLSLVGRSDECQLVLTDNSVSTYHASLLRTPFGIWVVDLLSREGIWVNGTRVRWAWLDDGDTLRFGRFTFVLRYGSLPDRIGRPEVPLDAGSFLRASPVAPANFLRKLGSEEKNGLALQSSQAARARPPIAPSSPMVAALSVASSRRDDLSWITEMGTGPASVWNQHMQLLEMLHGEMMLMVRIFMTMHREHVGTIRDELDRVEQLTRELESLQIKLGQSSSAQQGSQTARLEHRHLQNERIMAAETKNESRSLSSTSAGASESREHRKPPQLAMKSGVERAPTPPATEREPRGEEHSPQIDVVEFHAQISRRIAELQRERQGYWRKILSVMSVSAKS